MIKDNLYHYNSSQVGSNITDEATFSDPNQQVEYIDYDFRHEKPKKIVLSKQRGTKVGIFEQLCQFGDIHPSES